jgi:hypothetical protein
MYISCIKAVLIVSTRKTLLLEKDRSSAYCAHSKDFAFGKDAISRRVLTLQSVPKPTLMGRWARRSEKWHLAQLLQPPINFSSCSIVPFTFSWRLYSGECTTYYLLHHQACWKPIRERLGSANSCKRMLYTPWPHTVTATLTNTVAVELRCRTIAVDTESQINFVSRVWWSTCTIFGVFRCDEWINDDKYENK